MTERSGQAPGAAVLVIGIGNDLRGDDGAGRVVVEAVQGYEPPGVEAIWTHQLVPELAEQMASADRVIFVDAAVDSGRRARARRVVAGPPTIRGHHAGPGALLGLARLAGLRVPEAFLVTVPAHDFGLATDPSPAGRAAARTATALVLRLCDPGRARRRAAVPSVGQTLTMAPSIGHIARQAGSPPSDSHSSQRLGSMT